MRIPKADWAWIVVSMAAFLFFGGVSYAGTPLVNVVNKVQSARSEAMGGAGVAMSGDAAMVWTSPAAAAGTGQWALCLGGERGLFEEMTGQAILGFPAWGTYVFCGGGGYDTGSVTLNASDGTSRKVTGQRDFMGLVGVAGEMGEGYRQGLQLKLMHSNFLEEFSAASIVADWGAQADWSDFMTGGVALQNFGPTMKYLEDIVSQPATARAGAAFRLAFGEFWGKAEDSPNRLLLTADIEHSFARAKATLCGGAELRLGGVLMLRGGGRLGPAKQIGNVSAGIGVDIRRETAENTYRYRFDYTLHFLTGGFDIPHSVSLTCLF